MKTPSSAALRQSKPGLLHLSGKAVCTSFCRARAAIVTRAVGAYKAIAEVVHHRFAHPAVSVLTAQEHVYSRKPDPKKDKIVYEGGCIACHGAEGRGAAKASTEFKRPDASGVSLGPQLRIVQSCC
jgi:hypothetical protein